MLSVQYNSHNTSGQRDGSRSVGEPGERRGLKTCKTEQHLLFLWHSSGGVCVVVVDM